jgi:hypothetical protein
MPLEGKSMNERNSVSYVVTSAKKVAQPVLPTSPKPNKPDAPGEHPDRHAAITGKINDWNDYRRWVRTTRDNCKKEDDKD